MITLNEYQLFTRTTAVYELSDGVDYCLLGLVGEYGEWLAKNNLFDSVGIVAELGDMLWYVSELATNLGIELNRVMQFERMERQTPELILSITELCQLRKREIRDGRPMSLTDASMHIANILIAIHQKHDLWQLMEHNRAKLTSRQLRGVIHGSGDNR